MSINNNLLPRFGDPVSEWYRQFAIIPVWTIDRGWVWMRTYWKRTVVKHEFLDGGPDFWFQCVVRK
jgi:hypothetical protein